MSNKERKIYHVTKDGDQWKVKSPSNQRASGRHEKKQQAIEQARDLAKSQDFSQVIVHGLDGRIQNEWTYGKDPYPAQRP